MWTKILGPGVENQSIETVHSVDSPLQQHLASDWTGTSFSALCTTTITRPERQSCYSQMNLSLTKMHGSKSTLLGGCIQRGDHFTRQYCRRRHHHAYQHRNYHLYEFVITLGLIFNVHSCRYLLLGRLACFRGLVSV